MTWCYKRVFPLGAPCQMTPGHDGECDHVLVPCGMCGDPTYMTGTKRCDPCWEAERQISRIVEVPGLRRLMLQDLVKTGAIERTRESKDLPQFVALVEEFLLAAIEPCVEVEFDEPTEEQKRNREISGRVKVLP